MRLPLLIAAIACSTVTFAQQNNKNVPAGSPDNIYDVKKLFLEKELHNPAEREEEGNDNDLTRFNRWFNLMEPRTYPDGKLPPKDVLLQAMPRKSASAKHAGKTTATPTWKLIGPKAIPSNFNGIGRVNCIAVPTQDTNMIVVGSAGGGVWISRDRGATWATNTDNFPSLSIADIAINPIHMDTMYAATGDGYGYENGGFNIFWGGLYSAGIMMSTDTGHTWTTTGLSYLQSDRDIIQKLLIHPVKTNILMAASRNGLKRSVDAGATWTTVAGGHIFSMAFHPTSPDTVYAIDSTNMIVSYDAGSSWSVLNTGMNASNDRCTIAVTPASPNSIWVLNNAERVRRSYNCGVSFTTLSGNPATSASFYGYYDRVLAVSPTDSNRIFAFGMYMAQSRNNGSSWSVIDNMHRVHVDFHAICINPLRSNTIYSGNDGGISVSYDGGSAWKNIGNGLVISQIYRVSSSRQTPAIKLCGLQDNGTFSHNGTEWWEVTGGDGMDNAIHPTNDMYQVSSYQYGNFFLSMDQGYSFSPISFAGDGTGAWVSPVVFNPISPDTIYFGLKNIYATYDGGASVFPLSTGSLFTSGAQALAVAPSNSRYMYACDYSRLMKSTDGGTTWLNVSTGLPAGQAKTGIAVDHRDPNKVYVTVSGYMAANKVYMTTNGGTSWTNITTGLPNVPANCVAVDSSTPGAVFVGTDMGVYYRDDSTTTWALYNTGLPNVIVDDIDVNYGNYMVRAATYGRGLWECRLKKDPPANLSVTAPVQQSFMLYPNPTVNYWKIVFNNNKPENFAVTVTDVTGKVVMTQRDLETIDASSLAKGMYTVTVAADKAHHTIKAVKY